jgi:hypothetical protein
MSSLPDSILALTPRDREEAWWMWQSLGQALVAKHPAAVDHHLYAAFVAYRQLSIGASETLENAFRAGCAAGIKRERTLRHEAEVGHARQLLARCEEEVSRTRGDAGLPLTHAHALCDVARWRARVAELEGGGR